MKARRREKASLDALDELVAHLDGMALGRTVVLVVSDGWRLFGENREPDEASHASGRRHHAVWPHRSAATARPPAVSGVSRVECEADLRALARLDHSQRLRDLSEAANRSLVTFYPVNGEGLGVRCRGGRMSGAACAATRDRQSPVPGRQHRWHRDAGGRASVAVSPRGCSPKARRTTWCGTAPATRSWTGVSARCPRGRHVRTSRVRVRRGYRGPTPDELLSDRAARRARGRDRSAAEPPAHALPSFSIRTAAWASPTVARSGSWANWTRACGANWCGPRT